LIVLANVRPIAKRNGIGAFDALHEREGKRRGDEAGGGVKGRAKLDHCGGVKVDQLNR
jgi:hypothetical protein